MKRKIFRIFAAVMGISFGFFIGYYIKYLKENLPAFLYLDTYSDGSFNMKMPFYGTLVGESVKASVNLMEPLEINAGDKSQYSLKAKLFGFIDIKEVTVSVDEPKEVVVCGNPVGIYIETDGVYVVEVGDVTSSDGTVSAPAKGILCEGDYIQAVNGEDTKSISDLVEKIAQYGNDYIVLSIKRGSEKFDVKVLPEKSTDGSNKIGIWVKDDYQGLGTLTYVDEEGKFGTLGHSISDGNTGNLVEIGAGSLYTAKIWSVVKGEAGTPGEVIGSINYTGSTYLGKITSNTEIGVYGQADDGIYAYVDEVYTIVGYKQEIKKGSAYVRTYVDGEIKDYEIEITDVNYGDSAENKGIVFQVTDENLLEKTGGIIQGMSGSPIVQDNKIIGAVTHVFVNDPAKGYGIFIEKMLEQ